MGIIIGGSRNGAIIKESEGFQVVSLVVNQACNLKCKHCYLDTISNQSALLSDEEWRLLAGSFFADFPPARIGIVGREPLINPQSANLVTDMVEARNRIQAGASKKTEIGLITNGINLIRFSDTLLRHPPDYLDISADGLPEEHDSNRGKGAFSLLEPNLKWASRHFPGPLWLTPTLNRKNIGSFPNIIHFYNQAFGITKFALGFYIPTKEAGGDLTLFPDQVAKLVRQDLYELEKLQLKGPCEIFFDLDFFNSDIIECFAGEGWIGSGGGIGIFKTRYANGILLKINVTRIPVGFKHSVRVTADGFWLTAEDVFHTKRYSELAAANVRDFHFEAGRLYEAGIHSRRFQQIHDEQSEFRIKGQKYFIFQEGISYAMV